MREIGKQDSGKGTLLGQSKNGSRCRWGRAHWIFSLSEAGEPGQPPHRTTFSTEFCKCRNCTGTHALLWTLDTSTTPLTLGCESNEHQDAMLVHIRDGISRATELAEVTSVLPATVSRMEAALVKTCHITIQNRRCWPV